MTLTQLEYIIAVEKEKNFHRASESLHITQPTLSAQIKKLEEELGFKLFDRSKSPTVTTTLGEVVVRQAQKILSEVHNIKYLVEEELGQVKGDLRVAMIPTIGPYLLPYFLKRFNECYPEVRLSTFELTTEESLKALRAGEVDLALLATSESDKSFFQEPIFEEELLLLGHKDHSLLKKKKILIDDLRPEELWLLEEGHCLRDEIMSICHMRKIDGRRPFGLEIKAGSLEAIRHLVLENFGVTLIPWLATLRLSYKEKKLIRSLEERPQRTLYFTTIRKDLRRNLIEALKETVVEAIKEQQRKQARL